MCKQCCHFGGISSNLFDQAITVTAKQGGNSWGGLGGATAPPTFGQQHFFRVSDRKVASEVVLMGSFMSVI